MEYLEDLALEVRISWGNSVLRVAHLSPPRSFVLGVADSARKTASACDYVLPFDEFDGESIELVHVDNDEQSVSVRGLGNEEAVQLSRGGQIVREMRGLRFAVELSRKTKPLPKGVLAINDWAPAGYLALSLTTFGSLMGALAFAVPPIGLDDDSVPDMQRRLVMQHYLNAAAEREQERVEEQASDDGAPTGGNAGERASGDEGQIGKETSKSKEGRIAISGGSVTTPRRLSRTELVAAARDFGMVGMLKSLSEQDLDTPMHAFARDKALGPDDAMAHGNIWSADIGEAAGSGGLSLSGLDFGGGALQGNSGSIGIGPGGLGGMGFCRPPNPCKGGPGGWSSAVGRGGPGHVVKSPTMRPLTATVSGRIPPEVIRRIVRQNFGRFRLCYEQGLARNPNLEGRVSVRFVIGRDGAVNTASASSDLSDSAVTSCVQAAFYGLSFPRPEGGMVKVTYPIMFSPG